MRKLEGKRRRIVRPIMVEATQQSNFLPYHGDISRHLKSRRSARALLKGSTTLGYSKPPQPDRLTELKRKLYNDNVSLEKKGKILERISPYIDSKEFESLRFEVCGYHDYECENEYYDDNDYFYNGEWEDEHSDEAIDAYKKELSKLEQRYIHGSKADIDVCAQEELLAIEAIREAIRRFETRDWEELTCRQRGDKVHRERQPGAKRKTKEMRRLRQEKRERVSWDLAA